MLGAGADHGRHAHDRVLRIAAAVAVLAAVTTLSAGRGGTAYAFNRGGEPTVTPTDAPLSQLTAFNVVTTYNPDTVTVTVGVEFTGSGGPTMVGQLTPQSDGYLGGTFPATGAICGTNTVTLVDEGVAGDPAIIQLPITAYCPSIQIAPTSVTYASEPTTVQLTGTGFVDSSPIQITVDGHSVAQGTSSTAGVVSMPVTISGLGCTPTPHEVTVQMPPAGVPATVANSASAPLTVTGCPPATTSTQPPSTVKPTLAANPDVVEQGQVTHVTGSGFTPNSPVVLSWQPTDGSGTQTGPTVTANASGDIDDYLVVLLSDQYVPCDLVATQGAASASTPVLVQGGSMEPSSDDELVFRQ